MKFYDNRELKILFFTLGFSFFSVSALAKNHTAAMKSLSFEPKALGIRVGDSVEWANKAYTEYSATSFDDEKPNVKFDTSLIGPQKTSKKIEFKDPGIFSYHCSVHGKTMTGKIEVTP